MGYGSTFPTTAFGAAGMTFEESQEPYPVKYDKHLAAEEATLDVVVRTRIVCWPRTPRSGRKRGRRELEESSSRISYSSRTTSSSRAFRRSGCTRI
jgi:hypothetical protein